MVDKRYLVYMASSYTDVVGERLKLEYALLSSGAFPWEFSERRTSLNTAKARQQIDESDYVVFILSGKYGDLSASGISYLHLDFAYAYNKNKVIISFIDLHPDRKIRENQETDPELIKKLDAFRTLLKKDSTYVYEYTNNFHLERGAKALLAQAISEKPAVGWIRPQASDASQKEILRLKAEIVELERKLAVALVKKSESGAESEEDLENRDDVIKIQYRAHAYQDGNLYDVHPQRVMSWELILKVLGSHFTKPALESTFIRVMNEYLEKTGLDDARVFYSRAHAVARTQIDPRSVQQIKLQMKWNNWIVPQAENPTTNRVYWELTQEGRKHMNSLSKITA